MKIISLVLIFLCSVSAFAQSQGAKYIQVSQAFASALPLKVSDLTHSSNAGLPGRCYVKNDSKAIPALLTIQLRSGEQLKIVERESQNSRSAMWAAIVTLPNEPMDYYFNLDSNDKKYKVYGQTYYLSKIYDLENTKQGLTVLDFRKQTAHIIRHAGSYYIVSDLKGSQMCYFSKIFVRWN